MSMFSRYSFIILSSVIVQTDALAETAKQTAVKDLIDAPTWCKAYADNVRVSVQGVDTTRPTMLIGFTSKSNFTKHKLVEVKAFPAAISTSTCLSSLIYALSGKAGFYYNRTKVMVCRFMGNRRLKSLDAVDQYCSGQ